MIYWVFLIKIVPINTGPFLNGYGTMVVFELVYTLLLTACT